MRTTILSVVVMLGACAQQMKPVEVDPACTVDALEADAANTAWEGPGVVDGKLAAPAAGTQYVISTTYLALKPDADTIKLFNESTAPILQSMAANDGLVAWRFSSSDRCYGARTLTVWRDETAMLRFVGTDAHRNAMVLVQDLSRGGSNTAHWTGTEQDATWEKARAQLATTEASGY